MSPFIRAFCLAALAAAGCSHAAPASTMPGGGAQAAPTCDQVADKVMSKMATSDTNAEIAKKIRALLFNHCTQDGWSADMRTCLTAANVVNDIDRCESQLTPEQQKALASDPLAAGGEADDGAMDAPTAQPATPAKGASPRKPSDPCEGGQ